jgi:shikimate dehydrogenase
MIVPVRPCGSDLQARVIQHSSSPAMHVDEGNELGLSVSYELFDFDLMQGGADCLKNVLDEAEKRGFSGLEHHLSVQSRP